MRSQGENLVWWEPSKVPTQHKPRSKESVLVIIKPPFAEVLRRSVLFDVLEVKRDWHDRKPDAEPPAYASGKNWMSDIIKCSFFNLYKGCQSLVVKLYPIHIVATSYKAET